MNSGSGETPNTSAISSMDDLYKVIFVLGPPGSGKNTQCAKIVTRYNLIHFGCGDLLRAAAEEKSEEGEYINQLIKDGLIVPVRITCSLAKREMEKFGKVSNF
jgi:UMP-CMP kinase